jgi:hypothetical protein
MTSDLSAEALAKEESQDPEINKSWVPNNFSDVLKVSGM